MTSNVVSCKCGARVRLSSDGTNRSFRCPKCKETLTLQDSISVRATPLPGSVDIVCPICQTGMAESESCMTCPDCQQIHHQECWTEIGGCGTYGCGHAPAIDKSEQVAQVPHTAWGDTKTCPACGETIKSIALRCRYCKTEFGSVDPLSVGDLRQQVIESEALNTFRRYVITIFVVSLLGFLAPLSLLVGLVYLLPRRRQLAKSGPLFVIMGWTSIVLSSLYCVLLILFYWFSP